MENILVIDEDPLNRDELTDFLSHHSYQVLHADSLTEGAAVADEKHPDLIVININRQHPPDLEFIHELSGSADAAVIVTSHDRVEEHDKVSALEQGASDYIIKPYGFREFLARVRVALRSRSGRRTGSQHVVYSFANWRLSTRHRWLKDACGEKVKLTSAELNLLIAFLQAPRQILSREQLLLATRIHDQEIFDRSIDVLILRLRRKLGEDAASARYIKTERRAGYFFDAEVATEIPGMRRA